MLTKLSLGIQSFTQVTFGKLWSDKSQVQSTDAKVNILGRMLKNGMPNTTTRPQRSQIFSPLRFLCLASLFIGVRGQRTDPFPALIELSSLNGTEGFVIHGEEAGDLSGISTSDAGDVNGDGIDDLLIGAYLAFPPGGKRTGKAYVIFGSKGLGSSGVLELSSLNATTGYIFNGENGDDRFGYSVSSAGDVNGDGISDILVGAYRAEFLKRSRTGKTYVLSGGKHHGGERILDLGSLNGTHGVILNGEQPFDWSGFSVSDAGDVNGDDIDDLLVGAPESSLPGRSEVGKSYVIFGSRSLTSKSFIELSSLNGSEGFILNGEEAHDFSGRSISGAGDVNGDGIADILIGAYYADPFGLSKAGKTYVVFGSRLLGGSGVIELASLSGPDGFKINGVNDQEQSGISVSQAGDVNGDGISDILIGAFWADAFNNTKAGNTYVVFGGKGVGNSGNLNLSSLNGTNGFIILGEKMSDQSGHSVSNAGDVNGDGISDIIIGADSASPYDKTRAGKTYVVFGGVAIASNGIFKLSSLNGKNGFVLNGEDNTDRSGISVSSAGDINGDGISDILIGAYQADLIGRKNAGKTYVLFGRRVVEPLHPSNSPLTIAQSTAGSMKEVIPRTLTTKVDDSRSDTFTPAVFHKIMTVVDREGEGIVPGIAATVAAVFCLLIAGGTMVYCKKQASKNNPLNKLDDPQNRAFDGEYGLLPSLPQETVEYTIPPPPQGASVEYNRVGELLPTNEYESVEFPQENPNYESVFSKLGD